jgi:uncharacterized SAM-binding protein YcdF (DUF218 family)
MKAQGKTNRGWWLLVILGGAFAWWLAWKAGGFLLRDEPRPSDVILVLAGETDRRPERALELLGKGYGRRVMLDVPNHADFYGFSLMDLAESYVRGAPQAAAITICPIDGLSTRDESKDAERCLTKDGGKSVLIVTSDFHTRRALSIFRREVPGHDYSIAAARDEVQFGVRWWTHRQWAKTCVSEWMRLMWWEMVDRWR